MRLPKLTPLQSRFAASLAASILLLFLFFAFSKPNFAYALELDSIDHRDHNHPVITDWEEEVQDLQVSGPREDGEEDIYQSEFLGVHRSIIGRADGQTITPLLNNEPAKDYIATGAQLFYTFTQGSLTGPKTPTIPAFPPSSGKRAVNSSEIPDKEEYWGSEQDESSGWEDQTDRIQDMRKRQTSQTQLFLTLNVCDQPTPTQPGATGPPPQVSMYVSVDAANQHPGPGSSDLSQVQVVVDSGYGTLSINVTDTVYIGLDAPASVPGFQGNYSFEMTASIDAPYASYENTNDLLFVDSDRASAFFISTNLTSLNSSQSLKDQWLHLLPPFGIFINNANDTNFPGIRNSFCGLRNHAQIQGNLEGQDSNDIKVKMTVAGAGIPQQAYYVPGLNASSTYYAIMAIKSNYTQSGAGTVNGGGTVWNMTQFLTKTESNCQLIHNLSFCDAVNYAVPANPNKFPDANLLGTWYDSNAESIFQNFTNSLEQIPCNTTASAQYSLAVNCTTCTAAYKEWLCAVTIPHCTDFTSQLPFLQPRNIAQNFTNGSVPGLAFGGMAFTPQDQTYLAKSQSRFQLIDDVVAPGPYKEILPCIDLCYALVRNCPAALGFACPAVGSGINGSYGDDNVYNGQRTCSIPGAVWELQSGSSNVIIKGNLALTFMIICMALLI
ncbi:stretch-activated cation channel mid1 [Agyrium rufum]|nr:stretch-activated cation channel mid1 [Agyrium rufum]